MDITQESDADALWQDALDLLAGNGAPEAFLAMLRNCTPTSLEDGVLHVQTPMRLVLKRLSSNIGEIEAVLEQAAFEPVKLEASLAFRAALKQRPDAYDYAWLADALDRLHKPEEAAAMRRDGLMLTLQNNPPQ